MAKIFMVEENQEVEMDRTNIRDLLFQDVAEVTFTKADGTERVLNCTLIADMLPTVSKSEVKRQSIQRAPNPDVVAAFDLDKDAWRSFRVDSVKSIAFPDSVFDTESFKSHLTESLHNL